MLRQPVNGQPLIYFDSAASCPKPCVLGERLQQLYLAQYAKPHENHPLSVAMTEQLAHYKYFMPTTSTSKSLLCGLAAGLAGVAAMTLAEKLEQRFTGRPDSYVPAHTLARLLGLPRRPDAQRLGLNWAMHWGQGMVLGAVRGLMAARGVRGPIGSFLFLNLRLLNDQTLENATKAGALPWTWPRDEQVIDLVEKGIYAFTAGLVADHLIAGPARAPVARPGWTVGLKA